MKSHKYIIVLTSITYLYYYDIRCKSAIRGVLEMSIRIRELTLSICIEFSEAEELSPTMKQA